MFIMGSMTGAGIPRCMVDRLEMDGTCEVELLGRKIGASRCVVSWQVEMAGADGAQKDGRHNRPNIGA